MPAVLWKWQSLLQNGKSKSAYFMPKNNLDKPLTIRDIQEVLIPAMEAVFATKRELQNFVTKGDFAEFKAEMMEFKQEMMEFKAEMTGFKNDMYNFQDHVLKDMDTLLTEKTVGNYQIEKHRKMWQVVIPALEAKKILAPSQLKRIKALAVY